jgi:hypothetical protein
MKAANAMNRKWVQLFRRAFIRARADQSPDTLMQVFRDFCRSDDFVSDDIDRTYLMGYFEALWGTL